MTFAKELLDILVCPRCKGELSLLADESGLLCAPCALVYPIHDGIPIMLIDHAEKVGK